MVQFVGVDGVRRLVAAHGIDDFLAGLIRYVEADYARWESFDKVARPASHTPFGVIELMPTSDAELYAFKFVNGHPSNPARGFQTVTAFGALATVHNGYPVLVSEMTLLTAFRTAATSAMAAKYLARPDSAVMALTGAGSQAEFQALGIRQATGVNNLRVCDTDRHAMDKVRRNLEPFGFEVTLVDNAAESTAGADIVTTCTAEKAYATVLAADMVAAGMHVNAVGGDCPGKTELDPAILDHADVFVEFAPQTRIEGEIQQKPNGFPVTELWQVVTGRAAGRSSAAQVTVFDSVGFAVEDFSVLRYVYDLIQGTGIASDIDLIAAPDDPKNLLSLLPVPVPVR